MIDWQIVINALALPIVGLLVNYTRGVKTQNKETADALTNFRIEVAKDYVTHQDLREIKDSLIRIEATLAAKQDRHV